MDLQICIEGGVVDDYVALSGWLNGNRDFRGRIRQALGPPADGTLGGTGSRCSRSRSAPADSASP
jgi:hypothetical protein